MRRRPPRSTRFPYTTLFQSTNRRGQTTTFAYNARGQVTRRTGPDGAATDYAYDARGRLTSVPRSEEHTSELQSRQYLVCRLLLEKKKQKKLRWQQFHIKYTP